MKLYTVVVHYAGGYCVNIEAETEEEAWDLGYKAFERASPAELVNNLADAFVCDCWECKVD